jgi:glycosyltransferase involved in cell wall biosynthesis
VAPEIHIVTPTLVPYDAIGNDVVQMRGALLKSGYGVRIFAQQIHPAYTAIANFLDDAPRRLWTFAQDILIYHHSTGWPPGEDLLIKTRNKIILRYHNITPAHFFAAYSQPHTHGCEAGVEATKRIAKIPKMLIVGDSAYNCSDFVAHGAAASQCRVLAPLHLTEDLGRERFDLAILQNYSDATVNILFVGGLKPNKGHARAIRVFAHYHRSFNSDARLIFAGGIDERLRAYLEDLNTLATELGIADKVIFTGPVSGAQMKSLYVSADVFLCTSEHEGFCVPLLEAMYFRLPIVAWGITAVPETMGGCSFLLDEWNEREFAAHIDLIVSDHEKSERLGTDGRNRYHDAFAPDVLREKLCSIVTEATDA